MLLKRRDGVVSRLFESTTRSARVGSMVARVHPPRGGTAIFPSFYAISEPTKCCSNARSAHPADQARRPMYQSVSDDGLKIGRVVAGTSILMMMVVVDPTALAPSRRASSNLSIRAGVTTQGTGSIGTSMKERGGDRPAATIASSTARQSTSSSSDPIKIKKDASSTPWLR
jgi:hypothetical protein